jgi:hypothetical protein
VAQEIADLSSRHYKAMVTDLLRLKTVTHVGSGQVVELDDERHADFAWKRPEPPPYLWTTDGGRLPAWVCLRVDEDATLTLMDRLARDLDRYRPLVRLAARHYDSAG